MSQALLLYFNTFQDSIFKYYKEPMDYLAAFQSSSDGLDFLHRMMKERHPMLKDVINRTTPSAPVFKDFPNIHTFIQAYVEWIDDEYLRNGRVYNDKEKIDHILNNLDERFKIATDKIETMLDKIYANPLQPDAFPNQLLLTDRLGLYITDLIPDTRKEDLTNNVPTLHALTRSKSAQKSRNPGKKYDIRDTSRNPYQTRKNDKKDKMDETLEWRLLPGATCPACKKNNHNVYHTGCANFGLFASCKEFYDQAPKEHIEKVKASYQKYQRELGKKQRERRNHDKQTLRTVAANFEEEEVAKLQKVLFTNYKKDFAEEQHLEENPYDDYYFDESSDDESA
jgi:Zn ribbon nucleic-acid-binding protein